MRFYRAHVQQKSDNMDCKWRDSQNMCSASGVRVRNQKWCTEKMNEDTDT